MIVSEAKPVRVEPAARVPADAYRPCRSRLYTAGNSPRLLAGVDSHGADCTILDLEDSAPPGEKAAARVLVKHLLGAVDCHREIWIRINPLALGGREDLAEVLEGQPHGVCLPKAESRRAVHELADEFRRAEQRLGFKVGSTSIMSIIETAKGVLHCEEVSEADERVVMVAFGAEDYTRDIGARRTDHSLPFARSRVVAGAKAYGVQASDTVTADLADDSGLADECARARDLGFDGKGAIHPRQIPAIHRAFPKNSEELAMAHTAIEAAREAEKNGGGVLAVDGRMVDRPVVCRAQQLVKYAEELSQWSRE